MLRIRRPRRRGSRILDAAATRQREVSRLYHCGRRARVTRLAPRGSTGPARRLQTRDFNATCGSSVPPHTPLTSFAHGMGRRSRPSPFCPRKKGAELERDPTDLINGMNRGGERSQVVPREYLEIVVTRRWGMRRSEWSKRKPPRRAVLASIAGGPSVDRQRHHQDTPSASSVGRPNSPVTGRPATCWKRISASFVDAPY